VSGRGANETVSNAVGCWRMLDFHYMSSVLFSILSAKDEFSWSTDSVPASQLSSALADLYPR